jgi:hypothetical protein
VAPATSCQPPWLAMPLRMSERRRTHSQTVLPSVTRDIYVITAPACSSTRLFHVMSER